MPGMHRKHRSGSRRSRIHGRNSGGAASRDAETNLELLLVCVLESRIRDVLASEDAEVVNVDQRKCRYIYCTGRTDAEEICGALDILKNESGAEVFL